MIDERINKIRYDLGDAMGRYAPDYFRRSRRADAWMIGAGSVLFAMGIGYLAMRLADKRLTDVLERVMPGIVENGRLHIPGRRERIERTGRTRAERPSAGAEARATGSDDRPTVHGTSGGEMPRTEPW